MEQWSKVFDDTIPFFLFLVLCVPNNRLRFYLLGIGLIQGLGCLVIIVLSLEQFPNGIQTLPKHFFAGDQRCPKGLVILRGFQKHLVFVSHQQYLIDGIQLAQIAPDFLFIFLIFLF